MMYKIKGDVYIDLKWCMK